MRVARQVTGGSARAMDSTVPQGRLKSPGGGARATLACVATGLCPVQGWAGRPPPHHTNKTARRKAGRPVKKVYWWAEGCSEEGAVSGAMG